MFVLLCCNFFHMDKLITTQSILSLLICHSSHKNSSCQCMCPFGDFLLQPMGLFLSSCTIYHIFLSRLDSTLFFKHLYDIISFLLLHHCNHLGALDQERMGSAD